MNNKNCLGAKVAARNAVNRLAIERTPEILAALAPFVGKQVRLGSGGMSAKLSKVLDPFRGAGHWFDLSAYSLYIQFKVCELYPHSSGDSCGSAYAEQPIFLGEIKNGVLESLPLSGPDALRTDRTVAEILAARAAVQVARAALQEHEYKLAGFGEHDNF